MKQYPFGRPRKVKPLLLLLSICATISNGKTYPKRRRIEKGDKDKLDSVPSLSPSTSASPVPSSTSANPSLNLPSSSSVPSSPPPTNFFERSGTPTRFPSSTPNYPSIDISHIPTMISPMSPMPSPASLQISHNESHSSEPTPFSTAIPEVLIEFSSNQNFEINVNDLEQALLVFLNWEVFNPGDSDGLDCGKIHNTQVSISSKIEERSGTIIISGSWTGDQNHLPSEVDFIRAFGFWGSGEFVNLLMEQGVQGVDEILVYVNGKLVQLQPTQVGTNTSAHLVDGRKKRRSGAATFVFIMCLVAGTFAAGILILFKGIKGQEPREERSSAVFAEKERSTRMVHHHDNMNTTREESVDTQPRQTEVVLVVSRSEDDGGYSNELELIASSGISLNGESIYTSTEQVVRHSSDDMESSSVDDASSIFTKEVTSIKCNGPISPPQCLKNPDYDARRLDALMNAMNYE